MCGCVTVNFFPISLILFSVGSYSDQRNAHATKFKMPPVFMTFFFVYFTQTHYVKGSLNEVRQILVLFPLVTHNRLPLAFGLRGLKAALLLFGNEELTHTNAPMAQSNKG